MLKRVSHKRKFYLLLLGLGLLLIVAFKKSFLPTYRIFNTYKNSTEMTKHTDEAKQELEILINRTNQLDVSIGKQIENPELVQNKILDFLSATENDITVSSIEKLHVSKDDYFKIYSNTLVLKGDYNSLAKTVYDLENNFKYARIATVKFYTARNRKTKKNELFNKIIFQNYEKVN